MQAPSGSKTASPTPSARGGKGGFYLQPRSKVGVLGTCLTLMIAASVYAVLQSVNPDPRDTSLSARVWYPRETNSNARLQGVRCANDYACRLNSVVAIGTGELPEVWAVGNVGLVLHRKAGETRWDQLPIMVTEEKASAAPATPTPTPKPTPSPESSAAPTPTPVAIPTPTPPPTPTPGVLVPDLIGMRLEEAQKVAAVSGFRLEFDYGGRGSPVQQGPPPDYRVVQQSPAAGQLAPAKSFIHVILGRPPAKISLLDMFERRVYAAELDRRPQYAALVGDPGKPSRKPAPPKKHISPRRVTPSPSPTPAIQPSPAPLDDDLIDIACDDSKGCRALGRRGRLYKVGNSNEWSFTQLIFTRDSDGSPIDSISLKNSLRMQNGFYVLAKAGTTTFNCGTWLGRNCSPDRFIRTTESGDLVLEGYQLRKGPIIFSADSAHERNLPSEGVAVGDSGYIAKVVLDKDTFPIAETHTPVLSGTMATLRSVSFASSDSSPHGVIVGDQGIILSSNDGGATWRHETQGPEGVAPNHRLPALWYWVLAGLLIAISSVVVAVPAPPPPTEFSVADWTVTDAPLKPGDVDSLGFTPMALGLSRFIRNPKTQPPVTIAIEGEWGEGKSSVMALLRGDLEKSRFRPVWFNAWHHQSEEQLLASLLEHVKDQAVPPWWHIDNWFFRARLVYFRFREKLPLLFLLVVAFFGAAAFELTRHGLHWNDLVTFGTDIVNLVKYLLPWSSEKTLPNDAGHFGVVTTLIAISVTIFKKARAFGIDPAKLTDNLRDAATIKDIRPDPGIRPRFAGEFKDLCDAWSWGGRRVIIFIDDLDRCRPESVVTVLESINFLTTAGDCMMVLGMAQNQVTHSVGLGFKDIAHAEAAYLGGGNTEQEKAVARYNYGAFYIKKLVNIVAPLPKTTPHQRRAVLEAKAAEVRHQAEDKEQASRWARGRAGLWDWASQAGSMTLKAAPVLALFVAVALAVLIGYNQGNQHPEQQSSEQKSSGQQGQGGAGSGKADTTSTPPTATGKAAVAKALSIDDRPTSQPATLVEPDQSAGGVWWSFTAAALFLLLVFAILAYQLSARTNQDAKNSPEFEESLKLWGQYIVGVCDTPREIKRALNDLRYQAMTRRSNGPSITRGERWIRAMRQFVTGRAEPIPLETRVDEAALPPHKAADLAALNDQEMKMFLDPDKLDMKGSENFRRLIELKREHLRRFHRWIGEVQPVTEPTPLGPENPPPARAAQA